MNKEQLVKKFYNLNKSLYQKAKNPLKCHGPDHHFRAWKNAEYIIGKLKIKDFSDGLDLLNKLIPFCNKIYHHPNVHIYFRQWIFELTRYSIGGKVTERDFTIARKIEKLYQKLHP